jgi:hypothetical protein
MNHPATADPNRRGTGFGLCEQFSEFRFAHVLEVMERQVCRVFAADWMNDSAEPDEGGSRNCRDPA